MKLSKDNIRVLLNSAQKQRLHWSYMITTLMGFVIVLNGGLWTYSLIEYINVGGKYPNLILIPSAISAITLGLWRIYTRYLDNQIAAVYPELIMYEGELSAQHDFGVSGYLIRNVPNIGELLRSDLSLEKKSQALRTLAESNCLGNRGHSRIELTALTFIVFTFIGSLVSLWWIGEDCLQFPFVIIYGICLVAVIIGLVFVIYSLLAFQRNPSDELIKSVIDQLSQPKE